MLFLLLFLFTVVGVVVILFIIVGDVIVIAVRVFVHLIMANAGEIEIVVLSLCNE